ncbi:MAG: EAL domain-containing protein [Rhodospirillales bacterium]|jgi:EAL domain-containing protein (putative c-di-GMP-specific phosphodiesterase class I)|nr:EAL domain-containing protein [Rhodospirillales bacterium]
MELELGTKVALPIENLLRSLRSGSYKDQYNSLLLVSLDALPITPTNDDYWTSMNREIKTYCTRYVTQAFQISHDEFGFLVSLTDDNQINVVTDLKVRLISMINEVFPDLFSSIDQTRLVRRVDLNLKLPQTIKYVEQKIKLNTAPVESDVDQHPLRHSDIDKLITAMNKLGAPAFAKQFVTSQPIVCINDKHNIGKIASHEYFVSIGKVKEQILRDVDFRGSGILFNHMTVFLDKVFLSAFVEIHRHSRRSSLNLNVESVFTREFRTFVKDLKAKSLSEIIVEFRQEDVVHNYGNFLIAHEMITEYNGSTAIDGVNTDTIGLVNMVKLRPTSVKLFWREGAEKLILESADEIKKMLNAGIKVVLARVDDEEAVNIGRSLGIELFQGFYIDKFIAK